MKSIKSYFAIMVITALFISSVIAQPHSGKHRQHDQLSIEQMKAELDLTEDQAAQLETINQQFKTDIKALKADESSSMETKKEAFSVLRKNHKIAVKNVLTEEQVQKMQALKEIHREMTHERQAERRNYMKSIDREGMKKEMKAYKEENIRPVMLQQRMKLERDLSKKDKKEIAELNEKAKAFKAEMKAARQEFKANKNSGEKLSGDRKEAMRKQLEPYKAHLERAKALADKYDDEITELLEEIADERETWEQDIKSIRDKYLPEGKPEGLERHGKKPNHKFKGEHGKKESHGLSGDREQRQKIRFLLMDPNNKEAVSDAAIAPSTIKNLKVYPNPAVASNKLEYEVLKAGKVIVELQNQQGQILKTLVNRYQEPGAYTIDVDLSRERGNVFYYVIKNQNSVLSQKVIKASGR